MKSIIFKLTILAILTFLEISGVHSSTTKRTGSGSPQRQSKKEADVSTSKVRNPAGSGSPTRHSESMKQPGSNELSSENEPGKGPRIECVGLLNYLKYLRVNEKLCPPYHLDRMGYLVPENEEKLKLILDDVKDQLKMEELAKVVIKDGKPRYVPEDGKKKKWSQHHAFLEQVMSKLEKEANTFFPSLGAWDMDFPGGYYAYKCIVNPHIMYTADNAEERLLHLRVVYINDENTNLNRFLVYTYIPQSGSYILSDFFTQNPKTGQLTIYPYIPKSMVPTPPKNEKSVGESSNKNNK